jgi:DNA-binding response OmpR family regulator
MSTASVSASLPAQPVARLVALAADVQPGELILSDAPCEIGRSALRHVVVQRDFVSRLHAVIERNGERYWLRDAGSANGTFINGERIAQPCVLKDRDCIGLGDPAPVLQFFDADPTVFHLPKDDRIASHPAPHVESRLRYDANRLRFFIGESPIELTQTQFRLLLHLFQNRNSVCSREACAQAVWGRNYDPGLDAGALDKIVSKVRRRLEQVAPGSSALIRNHRGVGYWLDPFAWPAPSPASGGDECGNHAA